MLTKLFKDTDGNMSLLIEECHYIDGKIIEIKSCNDKEDQKPESNVRED